MHSIYMKKIKDIISASDKHRIFIPADFYHIAEPVNVGICLNRLCECGMLMRLMRKLYVKPSRVLHGAVKIAHAIARSYGGEAVPCGETALYLIGLRKETPKEWTFASNCIYKSYKCGGFSIIFKHTTKTGDFVRVSGDTALFIQALRAIGKNNITDEIIYELAKKVKKAEVSKMRYGTYKTAVWIKNYLHIISEKSLELSPFSRVTDKNKYKGNKKYATPLGYVVSSKSEYLITLYLHMAGIEFKYDMELFDDLGVFFKPDFTINYKGKEYFWEHLGKLDDPSYTDDWIIKERWYKENFPGQLLVTTEEPDIGTQIISMMRTKFDFVLT